MRKDSCGEILDPQRATVSKQSAVKVEEKMLVVERLSSRPIVFQMNRQGIRL